MSRRELWRRIGIWAAVAVYFVSMTWAISERGEPTGLIGFFAFPVVGALILTSRPGNGVGRFLLGVGMFWALTAPMLSNLTTALGAPWFESVWSALGWPLWGLLPAIGLIFPSGRAETRYSRILLWTLSGYVTLATVASIWATGPLPYSGRENQLAYSPAQPFVDVVLGPPGIAVFVALVFAIVIDLIIRWRHADGIPRLQYRWLVFALTFTVVTVIIAGLLNTLIPDVPWVPAATTVSGLVTNLIPISIGIAVTRHGLYQIDRVVSRTVSYAIVTLLAVGAYVLIVTSVTWLLPQAPSIAVASATLVAAAVFLPLLQWVQRRVDRRFDRERYDAQRVVDAFGRNLRTEVDPDAASSGLRGAVERALQPASVGVWVRESAP